MKGVCACHHCHFLQPTWEQRKAQGHSYPTLARGCVENLLTVPYSTGDSDSGMQVTASIPCYLHHPGVPVVWEQMLKGGTYALLLLYPAKPGSQSS